MKPLYLIALIYFGVVVPDSTEGNEEIRDQNILAIRGKGIVTQDTFVARADQIPEAHRYSALRDGNRFFDVVNSLLLFEQLAADARESGFDQQVVIQQRMQLAATRELGEAWLNHYVATQPVPDYEALAKEYYLVHRDELRSAPSIDVSHILISTKTRSDTEALARANELRSQIASDSEGFNEFAREVSDDPSVASNHGKFEGVKRGDMVPEFDQAAFLLDVGQISEPVLSGYGYHIIRVDAKNKPEIPKFEEVKDKIKAGEKTRHEDRIKQDYVGGLSSIPVEMSEADVQEMIRRVFGEEFLAEQNDEDKSE